MISSKIFLNNIHYRHKDFVFCNTPEFNNTIIENCVDSKENHNNHMLYNNKDSFDDSMANHYDSVKRIKTINKNREKWTLKDGPFSFRTLNGNTTRNNLYSNNQNMKTSN